MKRNKVGSHLQRGGLTTPSGRGWSAATSKCISSQPQPPLGVVAGLQPPLCFLFFFFKFYLFIFLIYIFFIKMDTCRHLISVDVELTWHLIESIKFLGNAGVPTSIPPPSHHTLSDFIFLFYNFILRVFT
jgi:hypothetical protein